MCRAYERPVCCNASGRLNVFFDMLVEAKDCHCRFTDSYEQKMESK